LNALRTVIFVESIHGAGDAMFVAWVLKCANYKVEKVTGHASVFRNWVVA